MESPKRFFGSLLILSIASVLHPSFIHVWENIKNNWEFFDSLLDHYLSLEALIGMGALMVAVLIPLAIFLMDNKSDNGFVWDRTVILTKILDAPRLLLSLLLLTTPLLFWESKNPLKPFFLILFVAGISLLLRSMVRAYNWIKVNEVGFGETYRNKMRIEYLRQLKEEDAKAIWSLTWNDQDGRALIDDRQLVTEFIRQLEAMQDKAISGATMLREFMSYLDKLQLSDPQVYDKVLNFSMKWASHLVDYNNENDNTNRLQFSSTATRLFFNLMERSFQDSFMTYLFFDGVKKYISTTSHKNFASFSERVAPNFFPSLEKINDRYDVWAEFPPEWKVSIENLSSSTKDVSLAWLNGYLHWITTRQLLTSKDEAKYDVFADDVTQNLFPKVEPIMWSNLLVLHWSPFGSTEGEDPVTAQVRNFLELNKTIGLIGRSTGFTDAKNADEVFRKQYAAQQEEVLRLNKEYTIFPFFRHPSKVNEYIKAAKKLSFDKGSTQEARRLGIIDTLNKIKSSLPKADSKKATKAANS